jgi:hypothetical protein
MKPVSCIQALRVSLSGLPMASLVNSVGQQQGKGSETEEY